MKKLYLIIVIIFTNLYSLAAQNTGYKIMQSAEQNSSQPKIQLFSTFPLSAQQLISEIPQKYYEETCAHKFFLIFKNNFVIISTSKVELSEGWEIISQATFTIVQKFQLFGEKEETYKIDTGTIKVDKLTGLILFVDLKLKKIDLYRT